MIIRKTCHAIYQKQIPSRVHFSWLKRSERASRARQRIGGVQAWKENDKKGKEKKRRTWNLFLPARRLKEFGAGQVKQTSMREKERKSFVFAYIEAVPRPYIVASTILSDPLWIPCAHILKPLLEIFPPSSSWYSKFHAFHGNTARRVFTQDVACNNRGERGRKEKHWKVSVVSPRAAYAHVSSLTYVPCETNWPKDGKLGNRARWSCGPVAFFFHLLL